MASAIAPKVRLVRCPKCRLVLPEVADVPVYKCGGCETVLVAKNRKAVAKTTSALQETEVAQANKPVHVSEHGESSSSSQQEVLPPPPQCHLSQESGGDQNVSSDAPTDDHDENLLTERQHNDQDKKDQNKSSDRDCEQDELDVNRPNEEQQNLSEKLQQECLEHCSVQQPGVPGEGSLSSELHHETEQLMLPAGANLGVEANDKTSQFESANCELDFDDRSDSNIRGLGIDNSPAHHENEKLMLLAGANSEAEANEEASLVESAYGELEFNNKNDSNIRDLGMDNTIAIGETSVTSTASAAVGEVISSDHLVSSANEHLEQPQESERYVLDRLKSTATFESADFATPSAEFSGPIEYLSKSNTARSSHAYDGSISSFDGIDDHFPDQQMHPLKNNYKVANGLVHEERHRRDKLPAKGMVNGNSGVRDHAKYTSSDLSYKKHYATEKYSKWSREELLEPVMHHHPPRNRPRLERDEYPSQIPFSQRASLRGYESAGPSRELHDEFPFDPAFHPLEKAEYAEQENMKLLRIMYELQDQISKTCHLNGNPNGRTSSDGPWRPKHFPSYYCQEQHQEEHFYPRYQGRHGQRSSWSQQSRFSRIPYSGGAINTRHHIDNSCLCCHPSDWPRSEQLPPPMFPHNRGFCRAHPGHNCYSSFSSCPSTPLRYLESDNSIWSHETISDDQRYKDHELKRYLRPVRRHLRPTAGGAPFVTCYHCFRPLQLPADFLLFKRRFHQLRCGGCSKVLKFSLKNGSHIVPYELVEAEAEPPPSEVEDCGHAVNVRISPSESCSHGCLQAEPMSYSDDYENSFCRSYSTDGDPVSHAKFHDLQGNAASSNHVEQRKDFVLKQSDYKHKNSAETFDSAGTSSSHSRSEKVSSELEELPPRTGSSPLHQLMGYSSPSQVIRG